MAALRHRCEQVLESAWSADIRYFDAARSYGRAEEFLAGWLDAHPERRPTVASKWGYRYVGDWSLEADVHEVKDHSAAALDRQWQESSALLRERLAVYQVHSLTPDSTALSDPATLGRLAAIRDSGTAIGVSVSGPNQASAVRAALAAHTDGRPLVSVVQATWNLLERSAGLALEEAAAAGVLVVVKESVANGRLVGAEAPDALRKLAAEASAGPDAVALMAALAQPWAGVVLSGAVSVEQLASNLRARRLLTEHPGLAEVAQRAVAPMDPTRYWSERSGRPWT